MLCIMVRKYSVVLDPEDAGKFNPNDIMNQVRIVLVDTTFPHYTAKNHKGYIKTLWQSNKFPFPRSKKKRKDYREPYGVLCPEGMSKIVIAKVEQLRKEMDLLLTNDIDKF